MPIVVLLVKAAIAIAAVLMLWPEISKGWKKFLIVAVAVLWIASSVMESIETRRSSDEQKKMSAAQVKIADALDTLKTNSEQEKNKAEVSAARNAEIRKNLLAFIAEGRRRIKSCPGEGADSKSEQVWTAKVETYLHSVNPADEEKFKEQEMPYVCDQSMRGKLWVLQGLVNDEYR